MSSSDNQPSELVDKIGIAASALCLVHCFFTTILIAGIPYLNLEFLGNHLFHEILALIVITMVALAIYPHYRTHRHVDIILIALAGISLIIAGVFLHHLPEKFAEPLTIVGSLLLITAHYRNIKARQKVCRH
jgi:hypothetical protein